MNFQDRHIEETLAVSKPGQFLAKEWMTWAVLFFLIASVFGLMMRYFFISEIPFFQFKHLLHAHSHVALLGWGFLLVSGILVFSMVKDPARLKIYTNLLLLMVLAVMGMSLTFPVQGYGLYSIGFSTMQLITSYVFAFYFLQDLKQAENNISTRLIRYSVYWMVLSSLGLWAIGPLGMVLGKLHPLYFLSVQWFLHFQLNGWFVYALLGLLIYFFSENGNRIFIPKISEYQLHISLFLTFALTISWSIPIEGLLTINGVGVVFQAVAIFLILKPIFKILFSNHHPSIGWIYRLLLVGVLSLILKVLLQTLTVFPQIAEISYTIRIYVIGFIHLVMLGAITFSLSAIALKNNWLPTSAISKWGWTLIVAGFILSEMFLFGQGTLLWWKLGFIPFYHQSLFLSSMLIPFGLSILFFDCVRKLIQAKSTNLTFNTTLFKTKTQRKAMKISLFISLGISLLLLTGCGGGSEKTGNFTRPVVEEELPEADPKGIGEVKEVDLDENIDEEMAQKGKAILDMKCTACHQFNDKRLVGPGFQGITNRRTPEWIMNMITNVDVMLAEDPTAQALLEECLTRMPNQNISITEARQILEYLRKNDLEKTGSKDEAAS